jgi:hypothetical protein
MRSRVAGTLGVALCTGLLTAAALAPLRNTPAPPNVLLGRGVLYGSVPNLSPAQRQQAVSLAMDWPALRGVTRGRRYRQSVAPWTSSDGHVVGALVTFVFRGSVTARGMWEYLVTRCKRREPSDDGGFPFRATFRGVTSVHVLVDFGRNTAVSVSPDEGATLIGAPRAVSQTEPSGCRSTVRARGRPGSLPRVTRFRHGQ